MRRKSTRRKKRDDEAAALFAVASKADADVHSKVVDIGELQASNNQRALEKQISGGSVNSRKSTVSFAVEGELEKLNIYEEHTEEENTRPQNKPGITSSSNHRQANDMPRPLETG